MSNITDKELRHLTHRQLVMFSLFCAYQIIDAWGNDRQVLERVSIIKRWLRGEATTEECANVLPAMAYMAVFYYTLTAIVEPKGAPNSCVCAGLHVSGHILGIKRKNFNKRIANESAIHEQREWLERYSEAYVVKEVLKIPER